MSYHLGDFALETTIYAKFTTVTTTGAPTQLAGTPVVSVYENDDNTQITAGVTLTVDEDAVTGLNQLAIAATAANGYEAGKFYTAVITTGTVGGTSVVGYCVASFTINAVSALRPTVAGRTLDVASTGEAGMDLANLNVPTGAIPVFGIVANGTAQAATTSTIQLASGETFGDDTPNGMTVWALGSTQGYWQARQISDYANATDTATVSPDWTETPSGTITYFVAPTPPAVTSGTLPLVNASAATSAVTSAATAQSTADSTTQSSVALTATSANVSTAQSAALSSATAQSTADSTTLSSVAIRATSAQASTTGSTAASVAVSAVTLTPSQVMSVAASAGGIHADSKKLNGATVQGVGTIADKWRG